MLATIVSSPYPLCLGCDCAFVWLLLLRFTLKLLSKNGMLSIAFVCWSKILVCVSSEKWIPGMWRTLIVATVAKTPLYNFLLRRKNVVAGVWAGRWAERWQREPDLVYIFSFVRCHRRHHRRRRRLLVISGIRLQLCHSDDIIEVMWNCLLCSLSVSLCASVRRITITVQEEEDEEKHPHGNLWNRKTRRMEENSRHLYQLWSLSLAVYFFHFFSQAHRFLSHRVLYFS